MGGTVFDLNQIRLDSTDYKSTFRTLIGVYSTSEVDGLLSGLGALTAEDIDTLAEINAVLVDADLASISYVTGLIGTTIQAYDADTAKLDIAQVWPATQRAAVDSNTFAADFDDDTSAGSLKQKMTLTADITDFTMSNGTEGQHRIWYFLQNGTGGWTITFAGIDGTEPTVDTAANALTVVEFEYVAGTGWRFV